MLTKLRTPIHLPRAHIDPVTSSQSMLAVFSLAIRRPLHDETIVLMLDNQLRGVGLMSFDSTESLSNNVNHAIGLCSSIIDAASLSICTVEARRYDASRFTPQLQTAQSLCSNAGLTLIDWFIVSRGSVLNLRLN